MQGTFAPLVTDRAIERMIEQDKGQIGFLGLFHLRRFRVDHHAFGHRYGTSRLQHRPARPDDFHQTHAATGHRIQLGMAAKDRDFNVQLGSGIHHQRPLGYDDFTAINREFYLLGHELTTSR